MAIVSSRLIGSSVAVQQLNDAIECAARSDAKVLVTGESGAGKEIVAGLIHRHSARAHRPFISINCAGMPDTLLESEFFGHVRGSFTDAVRDRPGLFERAEGGTVFLDEVGEMTPRMQGLLLRFLETGEIQRVGDDRVTRRVDIRVVAATNRVLSDSIEAGTFRLDLYYRLNVLHIEVPPLRDRRDDILPLVDYFVSSYAERYGIEAPRLAPGAAARLVDYRWPGNVRELKNIVERLVIRRVEAIEERDLASMVALPAAAVTRSELSSGVERLLQRLLVQRESFWSVVYDAFMAHDLTRDDVRAVVGRGLEKTHGSYAALVPLFNMKETDTTAFNNFLRKHRCQSPIVPLKVHDRATATSRLRPAAKAVS
jgi:transcriptional regulator with PAS, ATPase and Fis domain